LKAPIVIGRESSRRRLGGEPEPRDGSDARRLGRVFRLGGAERAAQLRERRTWVSFHHGGGVGKGYSRTPGQVIVCDGSDAAAKRIERVLGMIRRARDAPRDAGYEAALACGRAQGLDLPLAT